MKKLATLLILLSAISAFADVTITEQSDGSTLVTYFSKSKSAHYIDGQVTNITDMNKREISVLNPMGKTYFKASFDQMKALADKLNGAMKNQKGIKNTMTCTAKKSGTKMIAGYSCTQFELLSEATHSSASLCLSKDVENLIKNEMDYTKLENLMDSLDSGGSLDPLTDKISELEGKEGYILRENINILGTGISSEVISISTKKIDQSKFNIPAGYIKKPMPQAFDDY